MKIKTTEMMQLESRIRILENHIEKMTKIQLRILETIEKTVKKQKEIERKINVFV
jgi:TolA-binding protein